MTEPLEIVWKSSASEKIFSSLFILLNRKKANLRKNERRETERREDKGEREINREREGGKRSEDKFVDYLTRSSGVRTHIDTHTHTSIHPSIDDCLNKEPARINV